jgi:hypothetical protein
MKKFFKYNQSTHEAEVTLVQKGIKVTKRAKAHVDDLNYANQFTGLQIAEFRALIKLLELRSSRKLKRAKSLRNDAEFLETSAQTDIEEAQELRGLLAGYIMEKSNLYKNLKNPQHRVQWKELTEDMLNDNFKSSLVEPEEVFETSPDTQLLQGEIEDGKAES